MPAAEDAPSRHHHDETSPLLGGQAVVSSAAEAGDDDQAVGAANGDRVSSDDDEDRPLPVMQILLLCYARMAEPMAYFSIFPFINQMVQANGDVETSDVGFYSGLIESLFSLTQMAVMLFWGRAADRVGRKPVLVASLVGFTAATGLFGFARTIPQMIVFRSLAGVFAGTIVTIRTMITEHSTAKTQARAFSWFAFANNLGLFLGPLIGGALADPAKQYGGGFADVKFFQDYPYAMATVVTSGFALSALIVVVLFVHETMPKSAIASGPAPMSTLELLKAPGVLIVLLLYGHVMLLGFAFTAVDPVFWFTPIPLGGFGFNELLISLFMCLTGVAQAFWILVIFPPLQRRIGTGGVLRACGIAYPVFFAVCPLLNVLLRVGGEGIRPLFFVLGSSSLVIGVGISMAFTGVQLALNDIAPSPHTLGTLNALALAFVSGVRAFAPVLFTSIYAIGVRHQIVWGYLGWLVLIVLAAGFTLAVFWLPEKAEGKIPRKPSEDEEEEANGEAEAPNSQSRLRSAGVTPPRPKRRRWRGWAR